MANKENSAPALTRVILRNLFSESTNMDDYPWQPFHPGAEIHRLYENGDGASAVLLRYQPGAPVPHHTHVGFEHSIVLAGAQSDAPGLYGPGTVMISGPETGHAITSEIGCIVPAIREKPVAFDQAGS